MGSCDSPPLRWLWRILVAAWVTAVASLLWWSVIVAGIAFGIVIVTSIIAQALCFEQWAVDEDAPAREQTRSRPWDDDGQAG